MRRLVLGVSSSLISTPANGPSAATIGLRGTKNPGLLIHLNQSAVFSAVGVLPGCPEKKQRQEKKKCGVVKSYKVGLAAAAAAAGRISLLAVDADFLKLQTQDFKILNSTC